MIIQNTLKYFGYKISRVPDELRVQDYATYSKESIEKCRFYNVGAGSFHHPYWTNIDFVSDWYSGVQKNVIHYDLMQLNPLPIESDSAEIIYTSHTIEHVSDAAVANLFRESFRSLKKGGVLRVTTGPDAELDYRALLARDESWFYWDEFYNSPGTFEKVYFKPPANMSLEERWLHHVASQLVKNSKSPSKYKFSEEQIREILTLKSKSMEDALDYFTSLCEFNPEWPGNHISWWTHKKMIDLLKKAGFEIIYRSGYGQSVSRVLRNTKLFDNTHPQMSIYVEAVKS